MMIASSSSPCSPNPCGASAGSVHQFTLMTNHFHLALETPEPTLSRGMKWLEGKYAAVELGSVPGADHTLAIQAQRDSYRERVTSFLQSK
jgi:hypothetical protein